MPLDVLYVGQMERIVLSGILLSIRGAVRQGQDEQYLAGVLSLSEYICVNSGGNWHNVIQAAQATLGASRDVLDRALLLAGPNGGTV